MSSKYTLLYRVACLATLVLLFCSCGTGDDDGSRLGELIVGTWQRADLQIEGDTDFEPEDFTYDLFVFNGDGGYNGMVREGTFTSISKWGNVIFAGDYKCDNSTLRLEYDDEGTRRKIVAQVMSYDEKTMMLQYNVEDYNITIRLLLNYLGSQGYSSTVTSDE